MKRIMKISIRNLTVYMLVVLLAVFVAEALLSLKNRKDDNYFSMLSENNNILLMQIECWPTEKWFMSSTNVYNAQKYLLLDFKPEFKTGYPLIEELTDRIKGEDSFNVVVIGDSFVFGAQSTNRNELFWRQLENEFRQQGKKVNVFGVGATGANAYEELSWLINYSLIDDLKPDLVIFGYVYNDPDSSIQNNYNDVNWKEVMPFFDLMEKITPNIYTGVIQNLSTNIMYTYKYPNNNYLSYGDNLFSPILKGEFYKKYKTDFAEKLDDFAAKVDFPIVVMTLPTLPKNSMLEKLYEPLDEIFADCKNIHYYNSIYSFNDFASYKHKKNYSVNIADFHPGSATNRFYADYIKDFLEKDFSHLIESIPDGFENSNNITINEYLPYRISLVKKSEDKNSTEYELLYPSKSEEYKVMGVEVKPYFLINPLGKEHIKLSFSEPVDISEIEISGEYNSVELYNTCVNPRLNYDDHSIYEIKNLNNNTFALKKNKDVTSILISADFDENANRKISISFKK